MIERLPGTATYTVSVRFEGRTLQVPAGQSVAAALLGAGVRQFRQTPVSGAPRGPFCMMGICFDCLVIVDRVPNQQACMVEVRDGMCIEPQVGAALIGAAGPDDSDS